MRPNPAAPARPDVASAAAVVVVDDDPSYARLAQLLLQDDLPPGSVVRTATSVREALAVASGAPPGCVVLDLSLVDDDAGLAAIDLLRAGGVDAPVVVLSGRTDPGLASLAAARGAAAFVLKGDEHDGTLARAVLSALDP